MARDINGTYSLPAGNPVVTGTTILSSWANNTMTDIGTELTDSLSRSAKGGMLAAFKAVDGTAPAPGMSFVSETSLGIYRAGASILGFATAGVTRGNINATGNWAIAAPSSGVPLTINGAAATTVKMISRVGTTTGAQFDEFVNTSGQLWVGIETSVGATLATGTTAYAAVLATQTATGLFLGTNAATRLGINSTGNVTISVPTAGASLVIGSVAAGSGIIVNQSGGGAAFTVAAAGNVTIAAPTSGVALTATALAANFGLQLNSSAANFCGLQLTQSGQTSVAFYNPASTNSAVIQTGGADRITTTSAGNVTIAAPTSGTGLVINTVSDNHLALNATSGQYSTLLFQNAGTSKAQIYWDQTNSNVYVGTNIAASVGIYTNTVQRMLVSATGTVTINTPSSGSTLTANILANTGNAVALNDGTSNLQIITDASHNFYLGTTTSHSLTLRTANINALTINTSGDITARGIALVALQAADQSVNNSVALVDSTNLQVSLGVGTYRVRALLLFLQSAAGNAGLNVGIYASGGTITNPPSQVSYTGHVGPNTLNNYGNILSASATIYTTGAGVALSVGPNPCDWIEWEGIVKVTVATSLRVCFAQQTATAINTTLKASSCLEVTQLS